MQHGDPVLPRRFWAKVTIDVSGCWLWRGALNSMGYGRLLMGSRTDNSRRMALAHRLVWVAANGPIEDGLCVCHRCDNPRCVRVDHLFIGTRRDNSRDMLDKGREASGRRNGNHTMPERRPRGERHRSRTQPEGVMRGEAHPSTKMSVAGADEIVAAYRLGGESQRALAARFGLSQSQIGRITRGVRH